MYWQCHSVVAYVYSTLIQINEVNLHQVGLVLGWMTNDHYLMRKLSRHVTQPGHPSVGRRNEYRRKLGRKQAHRAMH